MAWIRTIGDAEATGAIAEQFAAARKRAGRVYQIVRLMSLNPAALEASMGLYRVLMFGESPLTRAQREMLAVVVSRANGCEY
jgi:uncharacterized peroxidase-related enzyme